MFLFRLAADAVALLHLAFVLFVVGGRTAGLALAPASLAPPAGGRLGRVDRVHRLDVPADPAGASPAASRRPGRLRRGLHRPLPAGAALSGRTDPRGAMGAGGGRPRGQRSSVRRPLVAVGAVGGPAWAKSIRMRVRAWRGSMALAWWRVAGPAPRIPPRCAIVPAADARLRLDVWGRELAGARGAVAAHSTHRVAWLADHGSTVLEALFLVALQEPGAPGRPGASLNRPQWVCCTRGETERWR